LLVVDLILHCLANRDDGVLQRERYPGAVLEMDVALVSPVRQMISQSVYSSS
jgi:hypothetical protein